MDLVRQKELLQILEQKLNGMGMQTAAAAGAGAPQVGDTLRVLVPITDEGEAVLLELMAAAIDEETDLLQFYTTMVMELDVDRGQLAQTPGVLQRRRGRLQRTPGKRGHAVPVFPHGT